MTPEAKKAIHERLVAARCDSTAILASLGPLACFTRNAEVMATHTAKVAISEADPIVSKRDDYAARWPEVLSKVRALIGQALNLMGDYENGSDCAMDTTIDISTPVFDLHEKRDKGETWDE